LPNIQQPSTAAVLQKTPYTKGA